MRRPRPGPALIWLSLIALTLSALPGQARADAPRERPDPIAWEPEWARVGWWSYAASGSLLLTAFGLRFFGPDPPPRWSYEDGILGDEAINEAIAMEPGAGYDAMTITGDVFFFGSMAYRAFDVSIVPGVIHGDWEVAGQMAAIDLEAFALHSIMLWGLQVGLGRERPVSRHCDDPERADLYVECDEVEGNLQRSFYGGHAATVSIAAGLTCVHHAHVPLYGGGAAEPAACATMIGAALFTAVSRMVTERHFFSDTLVGVGLGAATGVLVPLAHYGFGDDDEEGPRVDARRRPAVQWTAAPAPTRDGLGVTVLGVF